MKNCVLCETDGGEVVYRAEKWRVLIANEPNIPGFCRVVMNDHIAEMTDLPIEERTALMDVVWLVEQVVRDTMQPHKINLATLGNMVPHMHWHIIPRYNDDTTFPDSIWSAPRRTIAPEVLATRAQRVDALRQQLISQLTARYGESR